MQKRHFEMIARIVRSIVEPKERTRVAREFAMECAKANPLFDESRFLAACCVQN